MQAGTWVTLSPSAVAVTGTGSPRVQVPSKQSLQRRNLSWAEREVLLPPPVAATRRRPHPIYAMLPCAANELRRSQTHFDSWLHRPVPMAGRRWFRRARSRSVRECSNVSSAIDDWGSRTGDVAAGPFEYRFAQSASRFSREPLAHAFAYSRFEASTDIRR